MEAEYQESHRQFVSGHNGSEPIELLLVGVPVHGSHLLLIGLAQLLGLNYSSVPGLLLEGVVLLLPTLLRNLVDFHGRYVRRWFAFIQFGSLPRPVVQFCAL